MILIALEQNATTVFYTVKYRDIPYCPELLYSTVREHTVQYSTVQYSTVQCSRVAYALCVTSGLTCALHLLEHWSLLGPLDLPPDTLIGINGRKRKGKGRVGWGRLVGVRVD